ncbi:Cruciform DNA-recognizing protein-like protein [Tolypocladium capitatum]|uniref:Cruciform DNA-recognizing protein-like protein n=1 Tax=Tolypocladium capitatum TaxID=45235 RepID=A0A2K3QE44_9HYPO|nr:Cruciform DNA-recognizing protein-like protein [Tolypocladium capitatum]
MPPATSSYQKLPAATKALPPTFRALVLPTKATPAGTGAYQRWCHPAIPSTRTSNGVVVNPGRQTRNSASPPILPTNPPPLSVLHHHRLSHQLQRPLRSQRRRILNPRSQQWAAIPSSGTSTSPYPPRNPRGSSSLMAAAASAPVVDVTVVPPPATDRPTDRHREGPEHAAEDAFVTGTFDSWQKTVKLEKEGDVFQKTVELPESSEKVYYKRWTINPIPWCDPCEAKKATATATADPGRSDEYSDATPTPSSCVPSQASDAKQKGERLPAADADLSPPQRADRAAQGEARRRTVVVAVAPGVSPVQLV